MDRLDDIFNDLEDLDLRLEETASMLQLAQNAADSSNPVDILNSYGRFRNCIDGLRASLDDILRGLSLVRAEAKKEALT